MNPRGLHAHWDDLYANTRPQLFQMLRELEVPSFPTATNDELIAIIESRLDPKDSNKKAIARQIYTTLSYKQRTQQSFMLPRIIAVTFVLFLVYLIASFFTAPLPYCSDTITTKCRQCPDNANCARKKAKCGEDSFLSAVGCRKKSSQRLYTAAGHIAKYIAQRDGDCINDYPRLTLEEFTNMFPSFQPSIFQNETGFGIKIEDNYIFALKPKVPKICKVINAIDNNPNIIGPIIIGLCVLLFYYLYKRRHQNRIDKAKELAQEAHKILATTDQQIFMYDMKVQLRAKFSAIDSIWKYIVSFIEEDSHVLVGVVGARHEVYWKWVHNEC
ncbi:hypothetical protein TRFO_02911 [Tritrichomonas foetus]|uniref:Man1/Src1 C-terminal domain-containing protein n=1 Tax=Tritrichomonas foetus TaxID=1144522 RepID=A0A1J4L0T6_9EUKA|nr:hypothetical protein TRFO_02911 [Tritrichomonas foetus]|eukprot:OHT15564.1 hypothetical protein TRFO_02911 [Tritrichomonas foetus]